jgi:hypothetical protein
VEEVAAIASEKLRKEIDIGRCVYQIIRLSSAFGEFGEGKICAFSSCKD